MQGNSRLCRRTCTTSTNWRAFQPAVLHRHTCSRRASTSPPALSMEATPAAAAAGVRSRDSLVQDAIVWASQHGLVVGLGGDAPAAALVHAPLSALPVAFPRERFLMAKQAAPAFNTLVDAVAADEAYLESVLAAAAQHDSFTARLLGVLRETRTERQAMRPREIVFGIHRSDYMLDQPSGRFLQVELNTIASSFGCLSSLMTQLHRHVLGRAGAAGLDAALLPENPAMANIAAVIAGAHQQYVQQYGQPAAVVAMVVQPDERNVYDQQWIQQQLWQQHGVDMVRLTLAQIAQRGQLDPQGLLLVDGRPVSVAYYRAGYTPVDYPSEVEWQARLLVERSAAAKCPTVAYQLAGAKKVQQDLARPGVLERFVPDAAAAPQLREFFAGLWGLDDLQEPGTAAVVKAALADPGSYVLKPQREGGGNNLYGERLQAQLLGGRGLSAYILMQRIKPPPQRSLLVRGGACREDETLSELGVFGTFLRAGSEVLVNREAGHLVRTKTSSSDEGGVAAGFAVLDSPYLVDSEDMGSFRILEQVPA